MAYSASPEQTAREERARAKAAADERRTEKQRNAEAALVAKRDQAVLKAYPDWQEIKDSNIFLAWLAEQKKETSDKLDSRKATDVIAVIRQYHAELPEFANRYAAATRRLQPSQQPTPATVLPMDVPPRTDFAALDDETKLPYAKDTGRAGYKVYLTKQIPRAFAIAPEGAWGWADGGDDPLRRALNNCNRYRKNKADCRLYSVDDFVVWKTTD